MSEIAQLTSALSTLLPTYNGTFPPELLNLSTSLLAQSRNRASTLKPEENIARPFACAEIACKRLQSKLRLPRQEEWKRRPPCPPKVYAKLVTYLEGVLPRGNATKKRMVMAEDDDGSHDVEHARTPKKARLGDDSVSSTPTKKSLEGKLKTPTKSKPQTPVKKSPFAGKLKPSSSAVNGREEAPSHILPLIRRLCTAFSTSLAVPHIYTGFCTVFPLTDIPLPSGENTTFQKETSAMAIALFFMVLAKMQKPPTSTSDDPFESSTHLRRTEKAIQISGLSTAIGEYKAPLTSIDIDTWLTRISEQGWAQGMEWWDNVPEDVIEASNTSTEGDDDNDELGVDNEGTDVLVPATFAHGRKRRREPPQNVADENDNDDEDEEEEVDEEIERLAENGDILLPGLGTMMQEALDWGSKRNSREYQIWKKRILDEARRAEKGPAMKKAGGRNVTVRG